ncbi:helix-turn-helix domain-containing protein [Seonamhaeicola sp. ML3]|uniref:helix-turn-helix domain-containing protein n=1 Tax=Seonamhaeicola sp. ML3 TaxID=2937786 RepID=UPI00200DE3BB|nr:helix-turn-helix transcriptional regulator [Seonamhaeicola sp. ML3]
MTKKEFQIFIGKRIKQLREEKKISQVELANLCEFERSNMSRIEMGNTCPSSYTLYKIAQHLEVEVYQLLKFDNINS